MNKYKSQKELYSKINVVNKINYISNIDYCNTNINVIKKYYSNDFKIMNVPARTNLNISENTNETSYEYDIMFVGSINEKRQNILNKLKEKYKVLIIQNIYGNELKTWCNKSNICLNIHYYENAILERVRLNEMMEYGIKIISEKPCNDDIDICKKYDSIHFIEIIENLNLDKLIDTIEKVKYMNVDYKNNLNDLMIDFKRDIKILDIKNVMK